MTYFGPRVIANFRPEVNPNKPKKERSASHRPGMDPDHLANIRKLPSIISGKTPCDPHHLKIKKERGVGLKATDQWALPLTRSEHCDVEKLGSRRELEWFRKMGMENPYAAAKALWNARGDLDAMHRIIGAHIPRR